MDWVGSGCSIFVRVCRLEMPFGMRSSRERRRGKDYRRLKAHRMQGVECGLITRRFWFLVLLMRRGYWDVFLNWLAVLCVRRGFGSR